MELGESKRRGCTLDTFLCIPEMRLRAELDAQNLLAPPKRSAKANPAGFLRLVSPFPK